MTTLQTLQITWFVLWGVLWAVYFMLDGFVLGTGTLYNVLGKSDGEKRALLASVGPVWNGNEVWLVTAGGATFAAFPTTYALMFSYLYTALLLLLFSLIIRGVAIEFRDKMATPGWKKLWDAGIFVGSFGPALLFGVAFGNIFKGLPMDAAGYHGSLFTLLNPYGLLTGILFVALFVLHGAVYVSLKTTGDLSVRASALAARSWTALLVVAVLFLVYTAFATKLIVNYMGTPILFIVPVLAVASLLLIRVFLNKGQGLAAFAASSLTILLVSATGIIGLFPNLIPSSLDPAYSMTVYNSSSSLTTLAIMTVVALVFVPIVILYKIWVYRVFSDRISPEQAASEEAY
ncbi:MAG TPA: cytochrome d ubiquinol oxidase subunit II [Deltaproteobacteria bacterium]|jgi:cytochrome d ubiquinol oxidase subunit II|nr:cytochrome d ubiquinol oxidase subunit II [Deltaproteobacteria bacterium]HOI07563.1 cytochrome d ubiquinol oxidase subunit II [Deltaproteobacteria bacterium]